MIDLNAERAFADLKRVFPAWGDVLDASDTALADAIRSGGLANTKAVRIRQILALILEREGRFDLSRLSSMTDPDAHAYLTSLPGVGPKTASVVLSFALGRDAIPVDTHVYRVSRRLGLVPPRTSAERAAQVLHDLVPDGLRTPLHVALIRLGRETCRAPTPLCRGCVLMDICPSSGA